MIGEVSVPEVELTSCPKRQLGEESELDGNDLVSVLPWLARSVINVQIQGNSRS